MVRQALRRRRKLQVVYPATLGWDNFEQAIATSGVGSDSAVDLIFDHSAIEFAPVDSLVMMVCLYNRLSEDGTKVEIRWHSSQQSFGYAERIGFFNLLDERVRVVPERPSCGSTSFDVYQNRNRNVLEMTSLDPVSRAEADEVMGALSTRLRNLLGSCEGLDDAVNRIWTCASETIGNIYDHSATPVPGVIAAQVYTSDNRGRRVELVIADAGLGLLTTIRKGNPKAARGKKDGGLILEAFSKGLSSKLEAGRGCGLTQCAQLAAKYQGNLRVRTGTTWVKLVTKSQKGWTVGICNENAPMIAGTQLVFTFYLDRFARSANLVH